MHAYHITGTTADSAKLNISQAVADALAEKGWLITDKTIVWATHQYIDGKVVPIVLSKPTDFLPSPKIKRGKKQE